jgi:hypothetical protein
MATMIPNRTSLLSLPPPDRRVAAQMRTASATDPSGTESKASPAARGDNSWSARDTHPLPAGSFPHGTAIRRAGPPAMSQTNAGSVIAVAMQLNTKPTTGSEMRFGSTRRRYSQGARFARETVFALPVDPRGFEPLTFWLPARRSTS